MNSPVITESAPPSRIPAWAQLCIAFFLAFDVVAAWQWFDGAQASELGGHADEARHYLAAASLRNAVLDGSLKAMPPLAGDAPFFDAKLAGWMTCFGGGRLSVMLFMAVLAAANATLIFAVVRRECGLWAATVAGIIWLCAPMVRASAEMILPDQMQALTLTIAVLAWARLEKSQGWLVAAVFTLAGLAALFSGVPVLVVGVALADVLVVQRSFGMFRRAESWLALLLVVIPAMLWLRQPAVAANSLNFPDAGRELLSLLGVAVTGFALAAVVFGGRPRLDKNAAWSPCLAVVFGVVISATLYGQSPADRAVFTAAPSLAVLAACGAVAISRATTSAAADERERRRRQALWVLLLLLLALPTSLTSKWRKEWSGFGPIVDELLAQSPDGAHVLVVSDRRGEGMLLAELAMKDPQRRIIVERGSEMLADPARDGRPSPRFIDDERLLEHLTARPIRYVVLDSAVPYEGRADYQDQVRRILEDHPRQFWPVSSSVIIRAGEPQGHPLRIFRVVPADSPLAPPPQ